MEVREGQDGYKYIVWVLEAGGGKVGGQVVISAILTTQSCRCWRQYVMSVESRYKFPLI
jgi:hypothetical protein